MIRTAINLLCAAALCACVGQQPDRPSADFCSTLTPSLQSAIAPDCTTLRASVANRTAQGLDTPSTSGQLFILVQSMIGRQLHGLPGACVNSELSRRMSADDQTVLVAVRHQRMAAFE